MTRRLLLFLLPLTLAFSACTQPQRPPIPIHTLDDALTLFQEGQFAQSAEALSPFIEISDFVNDYDSAITLRLYRGTAYASLQQNERAIADFSRILELSPRHARALLARGDCRTQVGQFSAAEEDFTRLIRLHPTSPIAYYGRAVARDHQEDTPGAIEDLRTLLELVPGNAPASNLLAWLLATSPDPAIRNPAEALRIAQGAISPDSRNWNFLDTLATAHAATGDFPAAIRLERQAISVCTDAAARSSLQMHLDSFGQSRALRMPLPAIEADAR